MEDDEANGFPGPEAPATSLGDLDAQRIHDRSSMRKHRASVACNYCRFRKVRCSADGVKPCYNCVLDRVECVIPRRRPRGRPKGQTRSVASWVTSHTGPHQSVEPSEPVPEPLPEPEPEPEQEPANSWSGSWLPIKAAPQANESHVSLAVQQPCDALDSNSPFESWEAQETVAPDRHFDWYGAATQSLTSPISPSNNTTLPRLNAPVDPLYATATSNDDDDVDQELPPYVRPFSSDCPFEDLVYLRRKGALTLPDPELQSDLLKNYFELVHDSLPLVDRDSFQASIRNPARHGTISLLLLQAIMFSATAWADVKLVRRAGFLTRDAMRRAYYNKTKLLYDFNYERDRLAIVQSLTLLTTWWVTPTEQKDGYYWCSVALAVAKSIGLHRDAHSEGLPAPVRRLRRRIWWCCLIRDAITSLGCNRAPRIRSNDFVVAPLTLEDLQGSDGSLDANRPLSHVDQMGTKLSSICIASTKLCRILSVIVDLFYAENPIGHVGILYPKQDNNPVDEASSQTLPIENGLEKLEMCEQELQKWRDQVPDHLLHQSPVPMTASSTEQAVIIHRALLAMLYLVAQFCLHRPRALADGASSLGAHPNQTRASQKSMRAAAANLNKIVMDMYQVDLVRRLPGTCISCILTVSWSHVFDLQSPSAEVRREGARRFEECKLALRELVEINVAAEWAIGFLTFAASHVSRLFKRRQMLPPRASAAGTGGGSLGRRMPNPTQHVATVVATASNTTTKSTGAAAREASPTTRDWNRPNHYDLEAETRQRLGVGFPDYEDTVLAGPAFRLPDDDLFNLDFSDLTDMWVSMPRAWDMAQPSPGT
ncbi:hypothetical protein AYO21_02483 [Fonsecaea monophora]|uniref:Zn(2)-C6 fungal-type domain-containing protein n=1 Tax=Fonsecaea monophora TaxID=254056 RepID=A0A177FGD7_9EURO|nr:hypothetical protein AYO21_02483 [Fonsecaea monophora]OAG43197.1 hypothetical protein AYO21_02483 [Fonsecaea monophora]